MTRSAERFNMQQRLREAERYAAREQSTIDHLDGLVAAGTARQEDRALLFVLRRRVATGFVQPTGAQIMARVAEVRIARGLDPQTGLPS